ncbi:MAG: hypothetical protein R6V77_05415 [Candidatus Cloacimonadaceae bacterium]
MKKLIVLSILIILVFSIATLAAGSSKPATTTEKTVETTVQTTGLSGKPIETTQTKTTVETSSNAGKPIETTNTQTTVETSSNAGKPIETTNTQTTVETSGTTGKTVETTTQTQTRTQTQAVSKGVEKSYPGYLADNYSGKRGKDKDGYDLYLNPARHSLINIRAGSASGYGVFLRTSKGNFKFYPLDSRGSQQAAETLSRTNRKDNIYVVVHGSIGSDGVLYTSWIKEVANGKDKEKQKLKEREEIKQNQGNANKNKVKGKN